MFIPMNELQKLAESIDKALDDFAVPHTTVNILGYLDLYGMLPGYKTPVNKTKWVAYYHYNNFSYSCGYCGYSAPYQIIRGKAVQKKWNYCPNCGAKMEVNICK